MKKRHKRLLSSIAFISVVLIFTAFLAGKQMLEKQIQRSLAEKGFPDVAFSISALGWNAISFHNISLGEKIPLTLDSMTLDYSIMELLQGNLREAHLDHVGMKRDNITLDVHNIQLHFEAGRKGSWSIETVEIGKAPLPLPVLAGNGTFDMESGPLQVKGEFKSADQSHRANFAVFYDGDHPKLSTLNVLKAVLPWSGGVVSTQNVSIALGENQAIKLVLRLTDIPLNALLAAATSNRAKATGMVSGTLPVTISTDGNITFKSGQLKTADAGTITLSPDAIPGDNRQVALLRDILADFHYRELSLGMDSGKDDKLSMLLQLSGNNPKVYNGREVNLNVRLGGDVLNLIQQTLMPLADPKTFLKRKNDENDKP